ncbi:hypothetical protein A2cp1_1130 [Anaeromyxobacter dehalogenans 2CP-1]|uniref:Uncharacterized protein n=1 Tax=Anaeromyxobacter dehalogenans (strain ATCC BAA-258 / DSM 21875 / 2CP-1) TaxID=455488 RepID=B8JFN7_ANAD2|nr:hypothetical protein [Anaeromyxobacter dehalogenans]ACL64475.1 hypothetical protein A2cp1_1130 [Anaeromyxobacter dehalogenans 2CP-1]
MSITGAHTAARAGSDENLSAHLQMIQGVIGRMGQNAFNAKTWAITVMAAVFALGSTFTSSRTDAAIVALALLLFWTMDAYFLRQEHLFRDLYDAVVRGEAPMFSMDTSPHRAVVGSTLRFVVSRSVWPVHLITVLVVGARAFKG